MRSILVFLWEMAERGTETGDQPLLDQYDTAELDSE